MDLILKNKEKRQNSNDFKIRIYFDSFNPTKLIYYLILKF